MGGGATRVVGDGCTEKGGRDRLRPPLAPRARVAPPKIHRQVRVWTSLPAKFPRQCRLLIAHSTGANYDVSVLLCYVQVVVDTMLCSRQCRRLDELMTARLKQRTYRLCSFSRDGHDRKAEGRRCAGLGRVSGSLRHRSAQAPLPSSSSSPSPFTARSAPPWPSHAAAIFPSFPAPPPSPGRRRAGSSAGPAPPTHDLLLLRATPAPSTAAAGATFLLLDAVLCRRQPQCTAASSAAEARADQGGALQDFRLLRLRGIDVEWRHRRLLRL